MFFFLSLELETDKSFFLSTSAFDLVFGVNQGGISNGEIINMRVAFKPTPTIGVNSLSQAHKIPILSLWLKF